MSFPKFFDNASVNPFCYNKGKTYREILDSAKKGKIPISTEFYGKMKGVTLREFLFVGSLSYDKSPNMAFALATDWHGSYAPEGISFADANRKYGNRYEGYHVSENIFTGERILFPLAKKLPDANGREVNVFEAKDHIILVKLRTINGKPTIEYEHDPKINETRIYLNTGEITCVPRPTYYDAKQNYYELKDGNFVKSGSFNPNANTILMCNDTWNGFFGLGESIPILNSYRDSILRAGHSSSLSLWVIVKNVEEDLAELLKAVKSEDMGSETRKLFNHIIEQI